MASGIATMLKTASSIETKIWQIPDLDETSVYVTAKSFDLGHPDRDKYVDQIRFELEGISNIGESVVSLQVGVQDKLNKDIVWERFYLSSANDSIYLRKTARYFSIIFEDAVPQVRWKLGAIEFWGQLLKGQN